MPRRSRPIALRAEIIATMVANAIVNRGGPTYVTPRRRAHRRGADRHRPRLCRRPRRLRSCRARMPTSTRSTTGFRAWSSSSSIARSQELADLAHGLVPPQCRLRRRHRAGGLGLWGDRGGASRHARHGVARPLPPGAGRAAEALEARGCCRTLAERIAMLPALAAAADIHRVVAATRAPLGEVARYSTRPPGRSGSRGSRSSRTICRSTDQYDSLVRDRALETLASAHRRLSIEVIGAGGIEPWLARRGSVATHALDAIAAIAEGTMSLRGWRWRRAGSPISPAAEPVYSVAARRLRRPWSRAGSLPSRVSMRSRSCSNDA